MMVHVKQYNQVCSLVYEKCINQLKVRISVSIDSNLVSVLTYYSINNSVKKKMKLKHE